jgi:hypothetical protein
VTIVYDTPRSNSRILVIFDKKTQESRVVDYTKIHKNIESSEMVESVNEYGRTTVYTNKVETIKKTKEYTTVMTVFEEMIPAIKGKPINGIETTVMSTGTEYKIVTVDNGIVNQAVIHYNK